MQAFPDETLDSATSFWGIAVEPPTRHMSTPVPSNSASPFLERESAETLREWSFGLDMMELEQTSEFQPRLRRFGEG